MSVTWDVSNWCINFILAVRQCFHFLFICHNIRHMISVDVASQETYIGVTSGDVYRRDMLKKSFHPDEFISPSYLGHLGEIPLFS